MKNNKNIPREKIKVGMRVKVALPTFWAYRFKDRLKKYTWWKGKVIYVHPELGFNVYLSHLNLTIYVPKNLEYRIVKCL